MKMTQGGGCSTSCMKESVLVGEAGLIYDLMIMSETKQEHDRQLLYEDLTSGDRHSGPLISPPLTSFAPVESSRRGRPCESCYVILSYRRKDCLKKRKHTGFNTNLGKL